MSLIVQKYGGTSVANLEKIENVAHRVIRTRDEGNDVVVVLSAMAGETDRLIQLAQKASEKLVEREFDALISTGEQVTVTLLVGFMVGSLRKIWPFKVTLETMLDRHGDLVPVLEKNVLPEAGPLLWAALGLCLLGFVLISVLDHLQTRANPMVVWVSRVARRRV